MWVSLVCGLSPMGQYWVSTCDLQTPTQSGYGAAVIFTVVTSRSITSIVWGTVTQRSPKEGNSQILEQKSLQLRALLDILHFIILVKRKTEAQTGANFTSDYSCNSGWVIKIMLYLWHWGMLTVINAIISYYKKGWFKVTYFTDKKNWGSEICTSIFYTCSYQPPKERWHIALEFEDFRADSPQIHPSQWTQRMRCYSVQSDGHTERSSLHGTDTSTVLRRSLTVLSEGCCSLPY
jgi:hypothetical protein